MNRPKEDAKRKAVALSYRRGVDEAPAVVAKGRGNVAKKMIEAAKEHQIPIEEDETLVELLSELQLNEMIPEDLYAAVGEIFAFIYRMDKQAGKKQ
ncbi:EscU/YscU/HrcU family type III secretion system export apparatus switch protein [Terrilactibacillus sp. S3-3]|nr:EscU/YscU/HrcU family type III secretion system export apparatus switch protein [Terrilactibacillus sp. S3-3]